MENAMGFGILIVVIILMFINLGIYHKFVTKIYFDFTQGCITELIWAGVFSMLELGLIVWLFKSLFSGVLKFIGFLLKVALIILAVAAAGFVIWKIVQAVTGKTDENSDDDSKSDDKLQNDVADDKPHTEQDTETTEQAQNEEHMIACAGCGKMIPDSASFCKFCGAKIERD